MSKTITTQPFQKNMVKDSNEYDKENNFELNEGENWFRVILSPPHPCHRSDHVFPSLVMDKKREMNNPLGDVCNLPSSSSSKSRSNNNGQVIFCIDVDGLHAAIKDVRMPCVRKSSKFESKGTSDHLSNSCTIEDCDVFLSRRTNKRGDNYWKDAKCNDFGSNTILNLKDGNDSNVIATDDSIIKEREKENLEINQSDDTDNVIKIENHKHMLVLLTQIKEDQIKTKRISKVETTRNSFAILPRRQMRILQHDHVISIHAGNMIVAQLEYHYHYNHRHSHEYVMKEKRTVDIIRQEGVKDQDQFSKKGNQNDGGGNTENTASKRETSIRDKNQEGLEGEKQNDLAGDCNTVFPKESGTDLSKDFGSKSADLRRNAVDETSENKRHFDGERISMSNTLEKTTKEGNSKEITMFKTSSGGNAGLFLMEEEECRSHLSGDVVTKDVGYISTLTVDDNDDDEGKNAVNIHSKEATTLPSIVNTPLSTGILLTQPLDGDSSAKNDDEYLHDNRHNGVHDKIVDNDEEQDEQRQNEQVNKGNIQMADANNLNDNKVESDMDIHNESNLTVCYRPKEEKNKNEIEADKSHINASNNSIGNGDNSVILTQVYSMPLVADKVVTSTHGMVLSSSEEEDSSFTCDQDEMGDEDNREGTPLMDETDKGIGFEEGYQSDQEETNSLSQNGGLQKDAKTPIDKVTKSQKNESPFIDEKTLGPNKEIRKNDSTFNRPKKMVKNVQDVISDLKNNTNETNTTVDPYEEETQPLPPYVPVNECIKTEIKSKCFPEEIRKNVFVSVYAKDTAKCAMSNSYDINTEQESCMVPCSKEVDAIARDDEDDDDVTTIDAADHEETDPKIKEKIIKYPDREKVQTEQLPILSPACNNYQSKPRSGISPNIKDAKDRLMCTDPKTNSEDTETGSDTSCRPKTVDAVALTGCKRSLSGSAALMGCDRSVLESNVTVSIPDLGAKEFAPINTASVAPVREIYAECNKITTGSDEKIGLHNNDKQSLLNIDDDEDDDETTIDAEQEEIHLKNNECEGKRIGNASIIQRQAAQLAIPSAAHTNNHSKIYLSPNKFSQFSSNIRDSKNSSMSSGLKINDDPIKYDSEMASRPETVSALASAACKRSSSASEAFMVCVASALERDVDVSRIELGSEELAQANSFAATPIRTKGAECNESIPRRRQIEVGSNDEPSKTTYSPDHFTPDNIVEWVEAKHSQFNQRLSNNKEDNSPKDELNRNISTPCYDNKKEGEDKATKCQSHPHAAQSIHLQSSTSHVVATSSRKRKRREKTKTSFCIIFTGIEMTARYKKMIDCLGGTILDDIASASQATHVVAGDGKASLRRTPKLMICMCCTPNIVDVKWLVQSAKEKRVLECSDYLLLDKVAEEKYNFSMKNTIKNGCIVREARGGLLGGWYIYFCKGVAGNKAPPPEELKLIVKAASGRMLTSTTAKAIKDIDSTKIIIITSDPALPLQRTRQIAKLCEKGAKIFNTSWLFHSIVNQHLFEIDNTSKISSSLNAKVESAPFPNKNRRVSTRLKS